jgi:Ribonuclease G/E
VIARVHPDLAVYLEGEGREELARLEAALDVKVIVQPVDRQEHREDYDIRLR